MERRKYCRSSPSAFSILSLANSVLFTYDIVSSECGHFRTFHFLYQLLHVYDHSMAGLLKE